MNVALHCYPNRQRLVDLVTQQGSLLAHLDLPGKQWAVPVLGCAVAVSSQYTLCGSEHIILFSSLSGHVEGELGHISLQSTTIETSSWRLKGDTQLQHTTVPCNDWQSTKLQNLHARPV